MDKKVFFPNAITKSQIKILNSKCITNQYDIKSINRLSEP